MKYEIIEKSWSKRRRPDPKLEIQDIHLIDFKKEHNHFCKLNVTYADGSEESLIARVIYNEITRKWTVDGMKVAIKLNEDQD